MSGLIDADDLNKTLGIDSDSCSTCSWGYRGRCSRGCDFEDACCAIEDATTIDAVPVVRCRDCRWGEEKCGNIECGVDMNVPPEYHGYDWFCPNGERRRENE